jgi:hypothetical protein
MRFTTHFCICLLAAVFFATACPGTHQTSGPTGDIVSRMTLQEEVDQLHGICTPDHRRYVPRLHISAMLVTNSPAGARVAEPYL